MYNYLNISTRRKSMFNSINRSFTNAYNYLTESNETSKKRNTPESNSNEDPTSKSTPTTKRSKNEYSGTWEDSLKRAIRENDQEMIKELLEKGARIDISFFDDFDLSNLDLLDLLIRSTNSHEKPNIISSFEPGADNRVINRKCGEKGELFAGRIVTQIINTDDAKLLKFLLNHEKAEKHLFLDDSRFKKIIEKEQLEVGTNVILKLAKLNKHYFLGIALKHSTKLDKEAIQKLIIKKDINIMSRIPLKNYLENN